MTGELKDRVVDGPFAPGLRVTTVTLLTIITTIAFEATAISTVMPRVGQELGAGGDYAAAFSAMFTAQLLGIVIGGTWVGRSGPVRPAWVGQVLFGAGSLLAGLAPTYPVLLLGRVIAGLGGGLVVVAIYVIIGGVYRESARPTVFAWLSAMWVLPSIVGPLVAAWLAHVWSWRAAFLIVVPIIAVTCTAVAALRDLVPPREAAPTPGAASTLRLGLAIAAGAGAFQWAGGRLFPPTAVAVVTAIGGLAVLAAAVPPLLPLGTARLRPGLPAVIGARFVFMASFGGSVSFLPLFLTSQRGLSVGQAGLLLALASLGWAGGAWIQGRPGYLGRGADLVTIGAACVAAGGAGYTVVAAAGLPTWVIVPACAVTGVGMGLGSASISVLTLQLAPPQEHASASSALQLSDVLGSALGISVIGALYAALLHASSLGPPAFAAIFGLAAAIGAVGIPAGRRARGPRHPAGAPAPG